jgi:hypothetical protein
MKIEFGHEAPAGFQWATSGRMASRTVHVAVSEPYAVNALCGVGLWGTAEYTSGTVCPKCAREAKIKSVDSLGFDKSTGLSSERA